jgi:hypothetical protein
MKAQEGVNSYAIKENDLAQHALPGISATDDKQLTRAAVPTVDTYSAPYIYHGRSEYSRRRSSVASNESFTEDIRRYAEDSRMSLVFSAMPAHPEEESNLIRSMSDRRGNLLVDAALRKAGINDELRSGFSLYSGVDDTSRITYDFQ